MNLEGAKKALGRISKYGLHLYSDAAIEWITAVYLRLSREDGDKLESDSIANQRKIIDKFLGKNPDIKVFDYYIDDGFSGTNFERPEITRLLDDVKSGKVNCIIVKDLSRFGRNYHETGQYLEVVFPLLKLRFISVNDNIDSFKRPDSIGNSTVSFKNVLNDEYCRDISKKIRSSFLAKQKRGDYLGSFALYGYKKDPDDRHKLIIDEEAAQTVRMIYQMFLDGISIYNIAIKLNTLGILNPTEYKLSKGLKCNNKLQFDGVKAEWSTRTIRRMLKNEMYIGNMVQRTCQKVSYKIKKNISLSESQHIVVEGTHEAIIDRNIFDLVQARFEKDSWQRKGAITLDEQEDTGAIFVGYIKCADCGRAMRRTGYRTKTNSFYYFVCGSHLQWKQCSRHAFRVKKLEETVLTILRQYVSLAVEVEKVIDSVKDTPRTNPALLRLNKELDECQKEMEKTLNFQNGLYIDFKNELITQEQYLHFKGQTSKTLERLQVREDSLKKEMEGVSNEAELAESFVNTFKKYKNIDKLTREIVEELIEMIYVKGDGSLEIEFKFQDAFICAQEILSDLKGHCLSKNSI